MTPLKQEFVDNCPLEGGIRLRGLEMTRIEVFVDAAFAFAVTMLVISFDAIPTSYEEIIVAIKSIPAFIAAVVQLMWIWHTHNKWSKRYGLDTAWTVVLSTALLIVVLIYVYPMRIMASGMFSWFSQGYFPSSFQLNSIGELRDMFIFLGIGFISLCVVFVLMYRYAVVMSEALRLSDAELHKTRTFQYMWTGGAAIGMLAVTLATTLPSPWLPFSGFVYVLMGAWFPLIDARRRKSNPESPQT